MLTLMIRIAAVMLCIATGSVTMSAASRAGDDSYYYERSCAQLWYEHNSIYASAGYCFKSQRAKRVYGTGCFAPIGKLHIGQKSTVRNIKRVERAKGC